MKQKKILSIFNSISEESIPLEAFAFINKQKIQKHVYFLSKHFTIESYPKSFNRNLNIANSANSNSYPKLLFQLFKVLKKVKPDIVHVHHTRSVLFAVIFKYLFSYKLVMTVHSNFKNYSLLTKLTFLFAFISCKKIICNSDNTLNSIKFLGFNFKNKKVRIYNGVNQAQIKPKTKYTHKKGSYTIGTIGRIVQAKNHEFLVKSFNQLRKKNPNINLNLIIIGDGILRAKLETLINELGLSNSVSITGMLPRIKVYELLISFDLFVVTSKWEGFCNALVEAMYARVPVLVNNIDPLPEVLGGSGFIYQKENESSFIYAIEKIISLEPVSLNSEIESSYQHANNNYSLAANSENHTKLYLSI